MYAVFTGCIALGFACAKGGASDGDGDSDASTQPQDAPAAPRDANTSMMPDAPKTDGGIVQDAFIPPDAPPNSIFCTMNNQCTVAGECCLTFGGPMGFCAPGTIVLGACVPIT
ncbi:MAG TPA: hypothetical protein VIV11_39710 [Kofleriaceae bacterium]